MRRLLLICILILPPLLAAILWISSYWREDDIAFTRTIPLKDGSASIHEYRLASGSGILAFKHLFGGTLNTDESPSNDWKWFGRGSPSYLLLDPKGYFQEEPKHHFWNYLGFFYDDGVGSGLIYNMGMWRHRVWFCPWWFPTLLTSVPFLFYILRHRRRPFPRTLPPLLLRPSAHKPGDKCPECGSLVPPA